MKPRAMSEWIEAAASSAVWPRRSVHARVSFSPAVKNVIRSSASRRRRTTSSSAEGALAELRRVRLGHLRELRLQLQVDPARPVLDRQQRLRGQRLELGRQLAREVAQRVARIEVGEQRLQLLDLLAQPRVARLRLLLDPLQPPLDVVAVGDEQLELERLQVAGGIGAR